MADPLLTSLCTICHMSSPKYKCPACNTQTCSLACVSKHKSWAQCSGKRNVTKYENRQWLRTAAGIDHDYNFLHGMEMSMQRSEKVLIEEEGLVQREELRPLTMQEIRWVRDNRGGRDDGGGMKKILTTKVLREPKTRVLERLLAARLRRLNISVVFAPMGMQRARENKTSLNRKTNRVNWQVEWFTLEVNVDDNENDKDTLLSTSTEENESHGVAKRSLSKVMDDVPIYKAYKMMQDEETRLTNKAAGLIIKRPLRPSVAQNTTDSTWNDQPSILQEPTTGFWINRDDSSNMDKLWPSQEDKLQQEMYDYYLASAKARSDQKRTVTKMGPLDTFRDVLSGARVLEFPGVYVVESGRSLPGGFVLGEQEVSTSDEVEFHQKGQQQQKGWKRKENPVSGKAMGPASKRRRGRGGGGGLEDGEVGSDSEGDGAHFEVLHEESLGEEDEGEEDEDSPTSSSGSDTSSEGESSTSSDEE